MFVNFFIDRPIFASVLAIVIVVAGAVAIPFLPIAMFPQITPPQVVVQATYPGASAEVVEQTVTTPIEQQVNGVENMIYMSSRSGSDGTMTLTVTFKVGTDLDIAAVNVQNRVAIAQAKLPQDVIRQGLSITKQSPDLVEIVALTSPDGSRDELYLSNYASCPSGAAEEGRETVGAAPWLAVKWFDRFSRRYAVAAASGRSCGSVG